MKWKCKLCLIAYYWHLRKTSMSGKNTTFYLHFKEYYSGWMKHFNNVVHQPQKTLFRQQICLFLLSVKIKRIKVTNRLNLGHFDSSPVSTTKSPPTLKDSALLIVPFWLISKYTFSSVGPFVGHSKSYPIGIVSMSASAAYQTGVSSLYNASLQCIIWILSTLCSALDNGTGGYFRLNRWAFCLLGFVDFGIVAEFISVNMDGRGYGSGDCLMLYFLMFVLFDAVAFLIERVFAVYVD